MEQATGAVANASVSMSSYLPSPADLLMVVPRLFSKATSLGDALRNGGSVIAEPTANITNGTLATASTKFAQESLAAAASAAAGSPDDISMLQVFKNVASFFSYVTSKWAIGTFAIVSRAALTETRQC
jgi:hypothetical protein